MGHTASFQDVLSTLAEHEVEYLVVGGVAVGYYGYIKCRWRVMGNSPMNLTWTFGTIQPILIITDCLMLWKTS